VPPGSPKPSSNKGCLIALAIVAVLAVLGIGGLAVGAFLVGEAVDDAVDDGGFPGLPGAECAQFQFAYLSLTFTNILGAGADPSLQEQMENDLGELKSLAPEAIRSDMDVVADAFQESFRVATGGEGLLVGEESEERNQQAEAVLQDPEVVEAQENINRWVEQNCA
jgi:hypothetical protein